MIKGLVNSEEEMLAVLKVLPANSEMSTVRHKKFREINRLRIELERTLLNLAAEYRRPYSPPVTVVEAPPKPPEIPKDPPPPVPGRYRENMIIYWDYILNLLNKFSQVQIIYGVYN